MCLKTVVLSLLSLAVLNAGPVTVTLQNPASNLVDSSEYIGPYELDISTIGLVQALCINKNVETFVDDPYQATLTSLSSLKSLSLDADAYLYDQIVEPTQSNQNRIDIQDAAWGITTTPSMLAYSDAANTDAKNVDLAGLYLVEPTDLSSAQPFIVKLAASPTPEPISLTLMGIGLITLAIYSRRLTTTKQKVV